MALLAASSLGCSRDASRDPRAEADPEVLAAAYAPARWRLAHPDVLAQTMLWGSHLLIAHRDVQPRVASFELPDWTPGAAPPERTRQEAFVLAQSIARQLVESPSDFERLARELSADEGSREVGGSLGGRTAAELSQWPEVLDAFAALRPGQISRVLETEYGFHILLRRAPPEERRLNGKHIVIAYNEAPWLQQFLARRPVAARSRSEAFALAWQLYRELRDAPDRFARLLETYSDHRDALRGGDVGEWSSQEPTGLYRELEVLTGLELGEVAPPFDSPFGVQIMMRTPLVPRERYAQAALVRAFDPELPDADSNSRAAVVSELEAALPRLVEEPQRFEQLRATFCCLGVRSWEEGRGDAAEEALLRQLTPGQFAPRLLVQDGHASIIRRVEPATPQHRPLLLELPEPSAPDVDYLVATYGGHRMLDAIEERAVAELGLEPVTAEQLRRLGEFGQRLEACASEEERLAVFRDFQRAVQAILGAGRFEQYQRVFEAYLSDRLLRPRPDAIFRDRESGLPVAVWPGL